MEWKFLRWSRTEDPQTSILIFSNNNLSMQKLVFKESQQLSLTKLQYLKKVLDEVRSKPYKANPALITHILENLATVSYHKIDELRSMVLNEQCKPLEESQIAFIKVNYEKQKEDMERYKREENQQSCVKKDYVVEFLRYSDWRIPSSFLQTNLFDILK